MGTRVRPKRLSGRPRVSVVIPCYNYAQFLTQSVKSVLDQEDVDVDVLIVDDASKDASLSVAEALMADSRVSLIHHEYNRGHIATYNEGLAAARGDYVLLLSADDLVAPGSLGRAVSLMEAWPRVGLVYGWSPPFSGSEPPSPRRGMVRWSIWGGHEWLGLICRRAKNPVFTPSVVMRRDVMNAIGGYDPRLKHSADMYLWMQVALAFDIAHVDGTDQAFYRKHGENMHLVEYDGWVTDLCLRLETFEQFFREDGRRMPHAAQAAATARQALAADALRMATRLSYSRGDRSTEIGELLEFARKAWPPVHRDTRYHRLVVHAGGPSPRWAFVASCGAAAVDVRERVAWRYWRRFGMYP